MKTSLLTLLAGGVLLASAVTVRGADLAPEDVRNALKIGIRYLEASQDPNTGKWSEYGGQEGGITALCTLALLNAVETPETDQCIQRALTYLRKLQPNTTYVISLQTMVLCRATPAADQGIINHNVEWLVSTQIKDGFPDRRGGWSYGNITNSRSAIGDGSNSQFAMLALYDAARAAESDPEHISLTKIDPETWRRVLAYWSFNQNPDDGFWGYYKGMVGTGSMTCAGISSLVIADDVLHEPDAKVSGDQIDGCFRGSSDIRDKVDRGVDWLRRHFSVDANPPASTNDSGLWHYYFLYGLERAGRLSARCKIGEHDWYREGAAELIEAIGVRTVARECWKGRAHAEEDPNIATALALLFLSKGRWPVLMAKVQYGTDLDWNRHRSDVKNLTFYVESKWTQPKHARRDLTWQTIDLVKATVDDLLQVPVLFFSGGGNPCPEGDAPAKRLAANLRDYIDRGGFIFADGDPCSDKFDAGFRHLMELAFPEPEYRLKPLDESHPVWRAEQNVPPDQVRLLLGIDYGCRTSVIYSPVNNTYPRPSLACLWELARGGQRGRYSPSVEAQIRGGLTIGINVLAYATNRELLTKDVIEANPVTAQPADNKYDRGKFAAAKLRHLGGCDAAPRALANLMEQAAHDVKIRIETHPKLIDMQDPSLFDYPMVFMHGRNAFRLTEGERKALREYVERGGLLFADAICGNEAFADSFRREMALVFPKNALGSIPIHDPLWTSKYGGADLETVMRRDPQPGKPGEPPRSVLKAVPPELKGIRFGDRYGVIFSEFDLSCALEKHDSAECRGYTREDAARIGLNVLRYAIQQ